MVDFALWIGSAWLIFAAVGILVMVWALWTAQEGED